MKQGLSRSQGPRNETRMSLTPRQRAEWISDRHETRPYRILGHHIPTIASEVGNGGVQHNCIKVEHTAQHPGGPDSIVVIRRTLVLSGIHPVFVQAQIYLGTKPISESFADERPLPVQCPAAFQTPLEIRTERSHMLKPESDGCPSIATYRIGILNRGMIVIANRGMIVPVTFI